MALADYAHRFLWRRRKRMSNLSSLILSGQSYGVKGLKGGGGGRGA